MEQEGGRDAGQRWVVLLAAGEGSRVRKMTSGPDGVEVPKQFYAWGGTESMLQWTLKRSAAVAPLKRTVAVVAGQHRRWWKDQLSDLPVDNVLVQPKNRGTGAGILFPVLEILRRDPRATVAVMPTDHHVEHEPRLQVAIEEAFKAVGRDRKKVVLVGIEPRQWENGYGWIVPSGPPRGIQQVQTFVEKPDRSKGMKLMQSGALMNSFIFVGAAAAIHDMVADTAPEVARRLGIWQQAVQRTAARLDALYEAMPTCDFSREVLERSCASLAVVRAQDCEWTDLGTPDRVLRYKKRNGLDLVVSA
jgi:mannose-1-phosphate guanylyltransferase